MKKSVRDYMRDIEKIYKSAAEAVAADNDKLTELQEKRKAVWASRELTRQGQEKAVAAIDEQIKELKAEMYATRTDANNKAQAIRKDADKAFFGYFHANPSDVDLQMMKLIESGVVTDTELMRLSENANVTMRRMIGRALEHSKEGRFVKEGRYMQTVSENPHLNAIDELIGIGDYACGGAPQSGTAAAKPILKRWDELTVPVYDKAPNVSWNMDALKPGEISYTKESEGESNGSDA